MDLIKIAEEAFASGKQHPDFGPGDTITVAYRIKEGNKERIQQYRGVVIKISGEGAKSASPYAKCPTTSALSVSSPRVAVHRLHRSQQVWQSSPRQTVLPAWSHRQKARIKERRVKKA